MQLEVAQRMFVAVLDARCALKAFAAESGVLIRDAAGALLGAVGISRDTSDNDEAAAVAGITAAGVKADPGA